MKFNGFSCLPNGSNVDGLVGGFDWAILIELIGINGIL